MRLLRGRQAWVELDTSADRGNSALQGDYIIAAAIQVQLTKPHQFPSVLLITCSLQSSVVLNIYLRGLPSLSLGASNSHFKAALLSCHFRPT